MKLLLIVLKLSVFIAPLFSLGQQGNSRYYYPKDSTLSTATGQPKDSLTYYYPAEIRTNSGIVKMNLDDFKENWFSSTLYCAQTPVLFNHYLGHDIYRFLWLRSFDLPIVFTLNKWGEKVWLTTKKLNKEPEFLDVTYKNVKYKKSKNGKINFRKVVDSVVKADRKAEIIFTETRTLSIKEQDEFELLMKNCSFWDRIPVVDSSGKDGSQWIIEAHLENRYWFVNRWSPKDNFKIAGEFLIKESGINERIY